jgi:hypothetical protein
MSDDEKPPKLPLPAWVNELMQKIDAIPNVVNLSRQLQQEKELVQRLRAQRNLLIQQLSEQMNKNKESV